MKGLKYNYVAVPLLKGAQNDPEYAAKNPMQQIPTLVVSREGKTDFAIAESLAIMDYLNLQYPGPSIYPSDPEQRALALQIAQHIIAGIQPLQNLSVLAWIGSNVGQEKRTEWAVKVVTKGLKAIEDLVVAQGDAENRKFLVGDSVSIADICLVPQLYNARRFNIDLAPYPTLLRVEEHLNTLPEFKAAHPDAQPDANQV